MIIKALTMEMVGYDIIIKNKLFHLFYQSDFHILMEKVHIILAREIFENHQLFK